MNEINMNMNFKYTSGKSKAWNHWQKGLLAALTWILLVSAHARETERYIVAGPGVSRYTVRNLNMSPLLNQGLMIFTDLGIHEHGEEKINEFDCLFWHGNTKPSIYPSLTYSTISVTRVNFNWKHLRRIKEWEEQERTFFLGGTWMTKVGFRQHSQFSNNGFDSDVQSYLGLSSCIRQGITIKERQMMLDFSLNLPIVSYSVVPSFANSTPRDFLLDEDAKGYEYILSGSLASLGKTQFAYARLGISYYLKNGNAVSLNYHWDITNNEINNQILAMSHGLAITTMFNL